MLKSVYSVADCPSGNVWGSMFLSNFIEFTFRITLQYMNSSLQMYSQHTHKAKAKKAETILVDFLKRSSKVHFVMTKFTAFTTRSTGILFKLVSLRRY